MVVVGEASGSGAGRRHIDAAAPVGAAAAGADDVAVLLGIGGAADTDAGDEEAAVGGGLCGGRVDGDVAAPA